MFCGLYLKSSILVGLVVGMTIVDILSRLMCKNILRPPFLIPTTPEEGLHQNRKLICPYWPEESILGPKAMRLGFKDVEIPAAAGCVVRGWLIPPPDKSNDRNTVLIMSHGAGRDRRAWLRHCPFLIKAGYTCLVFDFRNHGTSDQFGGGGTFLGDAEWEDMCAVARWVQSSYPNMKAAFVGTSTGAVAAMVATVQEEEWLSKYITCIVAENPFSSIKALNAFVVANVGFKIVLCKGNDVAFALLSPLCALVTRLTHYRVTSAIRCVIPHSVPSAADVVDKVDVPMFIMHGTADQIVPLAHSEELFALSKQGPRLKHNAIWICPGAGHCQLWDKDAREFEARVLAFLDTHCRAS